MQCPTCQQEFTPKRSWQKFCSRRCNNKARKRPVGKQREWISGNWKRYLNRLVTIKDRKALTTDDLLALLEEQGGRCALTGVKLTNILVGGRKVWTNASVDRIVSGGPYIRSNIQLVCSAVNSFRSSMSIEEFREWCRLVSKFKGLPNARFRKRVPGISFQARAEEKPRPKKRGPARVDGGGTSAKGRRQGRRSQEADTQRRVKRALKPSRYSQK